MAADAASPPALKLRAIEQDDKCKRLSLGDKDYLPLTMFLAKDAKDHHVGNVAKTYVVVDADKVVAYVSINCSSILLDQAPEGITSYKYPDYPAVKIGKLAVDTAYRGLGLGKRLVNLAIATVVKNVMPHVGCRFMIVDAHQCAVEFYKARGFTLLDTEANKTLKNPLMFLDIGKLQQAADAAKT